MFEKIIRLNLNEVIADISAMNKNLPTENVLIGLFTTSLPAIFTTIYAASNGEGKIDIIVAPIAEIFPNVTKYQAMRVAQALDEFTVQRSLDDRDEEDHMEWIKRTIRNVVEAEMDAKSVSPNQVRPLFRLVVAGCRTFTDQAVVNARLTHLLSKKAETHDILVITGDCRGADALGRKWAIQNRHDVKEFPANWEKYGKSAGPIRNKEMAKVADALVAFWDYQSAGTKNMIEEMRALGKPVIIIDIRSISPAKPVQTPTPAPVAPAQKKGLFAFVDGSWNPKTPDCFGAAFVLVEKEGTVSRKIHEWSAPFKDPDAASSHNVAGEVYAAVAAMEWAAKQNTPICIVHDYNGIEKWCSGEWRAQKPISKKLVAAFEKTPKGLVTFRKVAAHSGNQWNDLADQMAKDAIK